MEGRNGLEMTQWDEEGGSPTSKKTEMKEIKDSLSRKKRNCEIFGVVMSPDTVAIAMVYFVQGVLGLSRLAVSFFLKDNLHLDPAEVCPARVKFQSICFEIRRDLSTI